MTTLELHHRWKLFKTRSTPSVGRRYWHCDDLMPLLDRLDRAYRRVTEFGPVFTDREQQRLDQLRGDAMAVLEPAWLASTACLARLEQGGEAETAELSSEQRDLLKRLFITNILEPLDDYRFALTGCRDDAFGERHR
ncbi:hypothetical protein ACUN9Y_13500 [Halomonas sp. V046]|uniref:hypothetical protein n=1 Tax=Halomonas sp. V046 TaxID=3459611 RepID=UPI004043A1DC